MRNHDGYQKRKRLSQSQIKIIHDTIPEDESECFEIDLNSGETNWAWGLY